LLLAAVWFLATLLLIEFGSSSLSEYRPLFKQERYLSIAAVPATLLVGMLLAGLRTCFGVPGRFGRIGSALRLAPALALVLFTATSLIALERGGRWKVQRRAQMRSVMERIRQWKGSTVYVTHWLWNTRVGFFMEYADDYFPSGYHPYHAVDLNTADEHSKNYYVQMLAPGEEMAPGLLLHDERLFELSRKPGSTNLVGAAEIPGVLAHPPDAWRLIERVDCGNFSRLALYEIEGGSWPPGD
jgi:hypothetical protein